MVEKNRVKSGKNFEIAVTGMKKMPLVKKKKKKKKRHITDFGIGANRCVYSYY